MTLKPWMLAENTYAHVREQKYEVAVLPLGATEPHNLHLPYGTDIFEGSIIGDKICEAAHLGGASVVLLPTIPYGTETNMREFPLAINLNPSTLNLVIMDIVESLLTSGIRKIVLLNSHGGNGLKPLLREMAGRTEAQLFLCDWYQSINDVYFEIFDKKEDHAGEMETSLGLAFFPALVGVKPGRNFDRGRWGNQSDSTGSGQSRLGFNYATMAFADQELWLCRPARGNGRKR